MARNVTKRTKLKQKMMTDSHYGHAPLYDRLRKMIEVIPVPIVTANHDGVNYLPPSLIVLGIYASF